MIPIGRKPKLTWGEDRWGWRIRSIRTNSYCYVCVEKWLHMEAFQNGIPKFFEQPEKEEVERFLLSKVRTDRPFEGEMSPALKRMASVIEHFLELSGGSTVWEFNGLAPNKKCWLRNVIVFGEKKEPMYIWNWRERFIIYPLFKMIVCVWNKIYGLMRN